MKTRITQSDIARVAGVHNTTVSLALRNCPSLPEATRKRIQVIAEEMGYSPDPALQALVAYRNGRMSNRRVETIAYVTNWNTRWGWRDVPCHAKFHAGAQRKASQCGYQLEHFWFGEPGMSERRLCSMLYYRGINGVILASYQSDCGALAEMDWSRLSAIRIGSFPHAPGFHRVTCDHAGAIRLAVQRIVAAGYRRIGLVLPRWCDEFANQAWTSGFLAEQYRLPAPDHVPMLLYGSAEVPAITLDQGGSAVELQAFKQWYYRWRPDVIVSSAAFVRTPMNKLGLSVPRDVASVDLFSDGAESRVAGIRESCERVGEIATELLIAQLQQNICGIPATGTATLVDATWVDGESLPGIHAQRPARAERGAPNRCHEHDLVAVP